jgi:thioredoxin-related protein
MPEFNKVYLEMGGEIQFMMVDITDGMRETVRIGTKYIADNKFSFPVFFDTEGEGAMYYGIRSIPTTLFIDKDGYVVTGVQGSIDESTLRKGIGFIN